MVKLRPNVWFKADFPDDTVYASDGNELQFAGQAVAQAIAEMLKARGYRVDEPENEYENGWSFNAHRERQRFWMQVTFIDDYILQTIDMTWRLWPRQAGFIAFLTDVEDSLKSDPRFSNLRWWTKNWPPTEAESFRSPVE
jgi:hypothetical protein